MSNQVFTTIAVSVDGFITGRDPRPGRGLGDGGVLHDWYFNGETPSQVLDGFKLDEVSARVFDAIASRVGAAVAGRKAYDDSEQWGGGSPHPNAPLVVLSHRPAPEGRDRQTFVHTGIEDAIEAAREIAGDKDVCLMGGGVVVTEALKAGLVDEIVLHQVPVLLGAGRRFFHELPEQISLELIEGVPTPGVTHLHYRVTR